jgi:hypothetical protein
MALLPEVAMRALLVVVPSIAVAACVMTGVKYSYDVKASFSERNSYAWAPTSSGYSTPYGRDRLVEVNVQAFADEILAQKKLTRSSGKSDLTMSVSYEWDSSYTLRRLDLYVYATDAKQLLWRGTAFGAIRTDAVAGELKPAVEGILSSFPPR